MEAQDLGVAGTQQGQPRDEVADLKRTLGGQKSWLTRRVKAAEDLVTFVAGQTKTQSHIDALQGAIMEIKEALKKEIDVLEKLMLKDPDRVDIYERAMSEEDERAGTAVEKVLTAISNCATPAPIQQSTQASQEREQRTIITVHHHLHWRHSCTYAGAKVQDWRQCRLVH